MDRQHVFVLDSRLADRPGPANNHRWERISNPYRHFPPVGHEFVRPNYTCVSQRITLPRVTDVHLAPMPRPKFDEKISPRELNDRHFSSLRSNIRTYLDRRVSRLN